MSVRNVSARFLKHQLGRVVYFLMFSILVIELVVSSTGISIPVLVIYYTQHGRHLDRNIPDEQGLSYDIDPVVCCFEVTGCEAGHFPMVHSAYGD